LNEEDEIASFVESNFSKQSRILVVLPEGKEILNTLFNNGFSCLYGISTDKNVYDMPNYNRIRYVYVPSLSTHFPPGFFDCCIVLKHTSRREIGYLREIVKDEGLILAKHETIDEVKQNDNAVRISERIGALMVSKYKERQSEVKSISLLCYSQGRGGIAEYTELLQRRLSGIAETDVINSVEEAQAETVIIEYARGLPLSARIVDDVEKLVSRGKHVIVEVHDSLSNLGKEKIEWLEQRCTLLYRSNESAMYDGVYRYYIMPHISYTNIEPLEPYESMELEMGTFGFANKYKRFDLLIKTARKIGVPLRMLISINEEAGKENSMRSISSLEKSIGAKLDRGMEVKKDGISIKVGYFTVEEIKNEMKYCSHIVFAHRSSSFYHSGTMTMAKRFTRPIIANDSFQSRQAQCIRVSSYILSSELKDSLLALGSSILKRRMIGYTLSQLFRTISGKSISTFLLMNTIREQIMDDDGFNYLVSVLKHHS
jgi:hypothetical protein